MFTIRQQEDHIFSPVCLFTGRGGDPCDHYPWCIGPHHARTPGSDIWWPKMETCSNLFSGGPQGGSLYDVTSYLAACSHVPSGGGLCLGEVLSKGSLSRGGLCQGEERVLRILLECFLVKYILTRHVFEMRGVVCKSGIHGNWSNSNHFSSCALQPGRHTTCKQTVCFKLFVYYDKLFYV